MNLKDYYSIMSRLYMNQMIVCAFAFIIILVPLFHQIDHGLVISAGALLLILMIIYLFRFVYFSSRYHSLPRPTRGRSLRSSRYLLLPAPSSETAYHLYSVNGYCKMTITLRKGKASSKWMNKDILNGKKKYWEIADHEQMKVWEIFQSEGRICIHCNDLSFIFLTERRGKRETSLRYGEDVYIYQMTRFTQTILKNGHPVLSVQKGVMPLALQAYFDANTPLIHLDSGLLDYEKTLLFFLLADNL